MQLISGEKEAPRSRVSDTQPKDMMERVLRGGVGMFEAGTHPK